MDVFLVALVLFAVMAFGAGDSKREDQADSSNVSSESKVYPVTRKHSGQFCDPWGGHITQRDLTIPLDQRVIDDEQ
ncbi:hypothetical protein E2F43_01685 [Seongchinamella unica]|uniref:Uncharacterized protein n=1 Tax=Seongchinamella unica TaxID=2547392 RepID=A0A4R5LUW5_9GAMM|nr:hypothetical protein [Seongchinamella unica]TDG14978.1 hypothetical protein E2F43_01685 [Seongchinamella unica]